MIRAVMLGRLGNNLFQYALGRTLAEKHGVPFVMDGSWFNAEGWSQVRCIRRLPGPAAGKVNIVRRFSLGARALLKATGKHYWEFRGIPVLKERGSDHTFDSRFHESPADCMLFGYFQSPLYFRGMEKQLRAELATDGLGLEVGHGELADSLRKLGSVAIHVRRTDYTGNPNLDLCGMDYYRAAMNNIRASVEKPVFHVFSDEPEWCSENFRDSDTRIITHPAPVCALTDLHLMSLANHHIIANSSYSWWAAWLGKKDGQMVQMPSRWFQAILAPIDEKQAEGWAIVEG